MAAKLTDGEVRRLSMMCQACLPPETHRFLFKVRVREELAKCLLKLGEADEAQALMVEAAGIRRGHKLPPNPYLSGMVQGASGAREIEGRILKKEKKSQDDPEYWLERAEYYRGRKEAAKEEDALRRGLARCRPAPQSPGKAPMQIRWRVLSGLANLLVREERPGEAAELLLKEVAEAPADSASAVGAARMLAYELPKHLDPDDPVLWKWLARRKKWEFAEERLVWRMLEAAPAESREKHVERAGKLAMRDGADPTRAATLGWVLNRMGETKRSIVLLKHALANTADEEWKERAGFTLSESYLDMKDWRAAESMFPLAFKRLTSAEAPGWLGRIAVVAAQTGNRDDAMRIFRRAANCNLRCRDLVEELSKHGLKDALRTYYQEVRRRLPTAKLAGMAEDKSSNMSRRISRSSNTGPKGSAVRDAAGVPRSGFPRAWPPPCSTARFSGRRFSTPTSTNSFPSPAWRTFSKTPRGGA
jgi:tetratricopeptide (TPR) repeat protein